MGRVDALGATSAIPVWFFEPGVQYMLIKCSEIQNLNFNFKFIYFIPHKKKTLFWDKSGLPRRSWCVGTPVGVTAFRGKEN